MSKDHESKVATCPVSGCGQSLLVSFGNGDVLASGKHIVCQGCGQLVWVPVGNYPSINFPHSTDRNGRPRLRTT